MTYSLLVPTRSRPSYLDVLIPNIYDKTTNLEDIEILFAVDEDDLISQGKVKFLQKKYSDMTIHLHIRKRTEFLNRDYYNWLATFAKGDFLWIFGDDLTIHINGWDEIIKERLDEYFITHKDRIVCASIRDNTPKPSPYLPKFPCFPMFSREAFEVSEMLLHPKIPTWGADYLAYVIYEPIKRLLIIEEEVYLNHKSYHTKQVTADGVANRIGSIFNRMKMIPENNIQRIEREEVPIIKQKLLAYINLHNK